MVMRFDEYDTLGHYFSPMIAVIIIHCFSPMIAFIRTYVMFCFVMLCFVLLCYVMFCFVMLCYVMFCFVMLCYVRLCYVLFVVTEAYFISTVSSALSQTII